MSGSLKKTERWGRTRVVTRAGLLALVVALGTLTLARGGGPAALSAPGAVPTTGPELSRAAAQSVVAKWQEIFDETSDGPSPPQPVVIADVEANSYLKFDGHEILPQGLYDPQIHMTRDGIYGSADVDFDELNRAESQSSGLGMTLLGEIFRGRQHVTAIGKLSTWNRQGRLTFQNVHVGSTALSDWLVNWLLQTYVESQYKIDLSKPFALPDHVTRIILYPGRAVFERAPRAKP